MGIYFDKINTLDGKLDSVCGIFDMLFIDQYLVDGFI